MRDSEHTSQYLWGGKPRPTTPWRTRPRPKALLLRWVNTLVAPSRNASDLHLVFSDGATLCTVLERLRPAAVGLVRFRRAVTRATALRNLEQALALVWQYSPQSCAMPSAAQLLDGGPRELLLRFVSELYSIFVVRPARARMPLALPWLQATLKRYGRRLSQGVLQPPLASWCKAYAPRSAAVAAQQPQEAPCHPRRGALRMRSC